MDRKSGKKKSKNDGEECRRKRKSGMKIGKFSCTESSGSESDGENCRRKTKGGRRREKRRNPPGSKSTQRKVVISLNYNSLNVHYFSESSSPKGKKKKKSGTRKKKPIAGAKTVKAKRDDDARRREQYKGIHVCGHDGTSTNAAFLSAVRWK